MITLVLIIVPIVLFSGSAHPQGYQANQVIIVELGEIISLPCSVKHDTILWFKQFAGHQPRIISFFQLLGETSFYNEFRDDRFHRSHFNLTISNIIQTDEAVYHCGSKAHYVTFGIGAHLIIKGQKDPSTTRSTFSKSNYLNDSMECQQKCYENNTKHVKTDPIVLGLAVALGLCGLLIFILLCLIFKRKLCLGGNRVTEGQNNRVTGLSGAQDTDDDILTYAAYV